MFIIRKCKGRYTYDINKEINILKANACKELGYIFEFWIIDPKCIGNIQF